MCLCLWVTLVFRRMQALSDALTLALSFDAPLLDSCLLSPPLHSALVRVMAAVAAPSCRWQKRASSEGPRLAASTRNFSRSWVSCMPKWEDSALLGSPPSPGERLADLLELQAPVQTSKVHQRFYLPSSYRTAPHPHPQAQSVSFLVQSPAILP